MAKARLLAPWVDEERRSAIYHCVSRVVDRRFIFGDAEREQFVTNLRMYEAFCGLRVLSYCVMSNHFHILVEVPPRMDESLSDEDLMERLRLIYSDDYVGMVEKQVRARA
jgi:REP element-mobilizing transposase RayT